MSPSLALVDHVSGVLARPALTVSTCRRDQAATEYACRRSWQNWPVYLFGVIYSHWAKFFAASTSLLDPLA